MEELKKNIEKHQRTNTENEITKHHRFQEGTKNNGRSIHGQKKIHLDMLEKMRKKNKLKSELLEIM